MKSTGFSLKNLVILFAILITSTSAFSQESYLFKKPKNLNEFADGLVRIGMIGDCTFLPEDVRTRFAAPHAQYCIRKGELEVELLCMKPFNGFRSFPTDDQLMVALLGTYRNQFQGVFESGACTDSIEELDLDN